VDGYTNAITPIAWFAHQIATQTTWPRHTVDASSSGADGVKLTDINGDGDLDVLICEENFGEDSEGLGVIWYENPEK